MRNAMKKGLLTTMLAAGSLAAATADTMAAVVVTFGEAVPTTNIITSYEADTQDSNAWFNDGAPPDFNGNRLVSQSFITPADSDYTLDKITMKLNQTVVQSFPESRPISIDFYRLSSPDQYPLDGTYISSEGGQLQATSDTATAGSYFTFDLENPVALTAGTSYAYVIAFDSPAAYQLLRLAISSGDADPAGTRAWQSTNGGTWVNTHETYVNYIQGTAVPEPAMGGLLVGGAALLMRRRARP